MVSGTKREEKKSQVGVFCNDGGVVIMSWAKLACGSSMATCKESKKPFRNSDLDNIHDLMWERANLEAATALCFYFIAQEQEGACGQFVEETKEIRVRERLRH